MEKIAKVHEKFLYEIWKEQSFIKNLCTRDGQHIQVVDNGVENKELGGPDFKNARIKIGNITYLGDIEIDCYHSDWKNHGHYLNKKYNKVILHLVLNSNSTQHYVFTQEGRKIQSISLNSFIAQDLHTHIQQAILSERKNRINKMPCAELNQLMIGKEKLNYLHELGLIRFKKKCEKMFERLKENTYLKELKLKEPVVKYELDESFYKRNFTQEDFKDREIWQQLIYESIFEALGYSKNKDIMYKLAKAVEISFLKKFDKKENFILYLESSLFNIGGMMPDVHNLPDEETSTYTKSLHELWNEIKLSYDGKTFDTSQWQFYKLRPQNFPTIRISGGARLLFRMLKNDLVIKVINKIERVENLNKLANDLREIFIVKGEGFWRKHYIFDQPAKVDIKYFIGLSRADEIIVNVVLPIISIYFEIFGKKELSQKILKLYLSYYQKCENNLVNEISTTLSLNDAGKRSIFYQGMIELFRNFCSRERCLECSIGKKVFN